MSEPMPTLPTQSPFTYPNPNSSASPSFTQDDTFMPNPSASPSFTQDDTFMPNMPEPIQPMPTFTQTAFSQPAITTQHTHLQQPTRQRQEKYEIWAMKMESRYRMLEIMNLLGGLFSKGTAQRDLGKEQKENNKLFILLFLVDKHLLLLAPTHSAFIGTTCSGSKPTYSDQQRIVPSVSQTSGCSDNLMECVLHSFVAENEQDQDMIYEDFDQVDQLEMEEMDLKWQMAMLSLRINRFEKKAGRKMNYNNQQPARFDRRKVRCYKCLQLGHFARECNVKTVDDKARYSAFKVTEVKTDEPKALVSVDSMVNWSDHAAENKTGEVEKVYGMMAGLHADNGGAGISNAADEFAMMGISPKAYQHAVKTLESQKDWYHKTQMALEEKIRVLTANLENTTNTLSYTETLHDQAQKEKKEWEVKYEATLARFEKWKESSKNLNKLINSSMSTRTKIGLGFKDYFGKDEVFDLSRPSTMYPEPAEEGVKPLYLRFFKAGKMHVVPLSITGTYMPTPYKSDIEETQASYGSKSNNNTSETISESNDFVSCDTSDKSSDSETYASCDSSLKTKTKDFPPAVDIKTLPESDVEDPNSTAGSPSFSCLENVKSPRIFCNKSGMNNRNVCKNNSVRVKKCFVCGSKLHLIKDCDFYNCVESVPCKSKTASVPAGSRNSPASVTAGGSDPAASRNKPAVNTAGGSDPAASRNKPAVNSAGRPNPAGWSKRPAPVSAGRQVSASWLNPAARPYFRPSSVYFNYIYDPKYMNEGREGRWGTAVKSSAGSRVISSSDIDLGQGRHCQIWRWDGRISGKGTIRTSKLDFENVYYVEELQHFNLWILRIPRDVILYSSASRTTARTKMLLDLVAKHPWMNPRWPQKDGHVNFKDNQQVSLGGLYYNPINKTPFEIDVWEADEGYLVGYAPNSKAYRVYNLTNKRVEETMNLRFLEDKPNVQGIGHEWYFDLDYLTDSLGYTRFKTDKPAGTQETNINAGTQDHDSDSEVDEQVIVVPSFPSNSFAGPSSSNGPSVMERNADYAEELAKASNDKKYDAYTQLLEWLFVSQETAEILSHA
ncbi:putative ribonuclease H-like domain-containing protein [Tanacetum coccineum]